MGIKICNFFLISLTIFIIVNSLTQINANSNHTGQGSSPPQSGKFKTGPSARLKKDASMSYLSNSNGKGLRHSRKFPTPSKYQQQYNHNGKNDEEDIYQSKTPQEVDLALSSQGYSLPSRATYINTKGQDPKDSQDTQDSQNYHYYYQPQPPYQHHHNPNPDYYHQVPYDYSGDIRTQLLHKYYTSLVLPQKGYHLALVSKPGIGLGNSLDTYSYGDIHKGIGQRGHQNQGNRWSNPKQGWGWMQTTNKPTNFSAVSLLGLLAVMGMIQHVMADLDSSTISSSQFINEFDSANSIGGRPLRPRPPRPIHTIRPTFRPTFHPTTVTQRPIITTRPTSMPMPGSSRSPINSDRFKRSLNKISLSPPTIHRVSTKLLPFFVAIANSLGSKNYNCARFYSYQIYTILMQDFLVPEPLSRSSISESLNLMQHQISQAQDKDKPQFDFRAWTKQFNYHNHGNNYSCTLE